MLLSEAGKYQKNLNKYLDFTRLISAVYVESRYPSGPPKGYSTEQISEWMILAEKLIEQLKKAM